MRQNLLEKVREAVQSVLPVSLIVLALHLFVAPLPPGTLVLFFIGAVFLFAGMIIFALGVDMAIMPMGELIGARLIRSRNVWLLIIASVILGIAVTAAEPDLHVLAGQVPGVPEAAVIISVAIGVGIFLVISLFRILLQWRLSTLLIIFYALVFGIAALLAPDFLGLAFDSSGVISGPITVPLILALGSGISAVRSGRGVEADNFGLLGLCAIGPIIVVLFMGRIFEPSAIGQGLEAAPDASTAGAIISLYAAALGQSAREVMIALSPIVIIFSAYQVLRLRLPSSRIIRIAVGVVYTVIGLTLFLSGVNVGFLPTGAALGTSIGALPNNWILIPLGFAIGFVVVTAEPAVLVLNKQVEDITSGAISRTTMLAGLSVGVGFALALAMARILGGINIWYFLLPGYAIALILSFFVPEIFTAIAFDSGGVAAGTIAAAFLLPLAIGVSDAVGGNVLTDAFGIIGMIAMLPLITIQLIGLVYAIRLKRTKKPVQEVSVEAPKPEIEIIDY